MDSVGHMVDNEASGYQEEVFEKSKEDEKEDHIFNGVFSCDFIFFSGKIRARRDGQHIFNSGGYSSRKDHLFSYFKRGRKDP